MKVQMKLNPSTIVEAEGETVKEVFEGLARLSEVFSFAKCGCCGGTQLKPQIFKGSKYASYWLVCLNPSCRAGISFGLTTEGGVLFPHLKERNGERKPNGGWTINRNNNEE